MQKRQRYLLAIGAAIFLTFDSAFPQAVTELKIDPLLLVSLNECNHIMESLGREIYPGWDFQDIPVLFYRPKIQELLINFPHQPAGFSDYTGFNPSKVEAISVRDNKTVFEVDDQNTTTEIDSIPILVIADQFSRMRNQLWGTILDRSPEFINQWLEDWNFIPSPYDEIRLILHEAFHVYQDRQAPEKSANENIVTQYPLLDPLNNALYALEGKTLRDALLADNPQIRLEKIKEFVAVRSHRHSRLEPDWIEYEKLNEYTEGTARYVEYKFMKIGEELEPTQEMYYHQGFNGYGGILKRQLEDRINDMVKIVSVSDDRFGNRFGAGPFRYKLYELGACQALLLDEVMPTWKEKIFADSMYLSDFLQHALALSSDDLVIYLEKAESEYNYDSIYSDRLQFEQEGKKAIEEKLASILNTSQTLVKIYYGELTDKIGIAYTPFGVTQVSKRSAIYDMVPIKVRFNEGIELEMKRVIPVLIDREKKMIAFAVATPASQLGTQADNKVETPDFNLSTAGMNNDREGNIIAIRLKRK
ncbi:MAG: hypothetical protein A2Z27_00555 [candidate division Zixibacteria bacterium RBG_16_50_21]|nr:MAG: hypothetical protein A2Z27_00555 [candidate division Zixibacteria bacterium RBG_16_50_21]